MKNPSVFIVVPSLITSGPIKGAVALCNSLVALLPVSLIYLKAGPKEIAGLDQRVKIISLAETMGFRKKIKSLCNEFEQAGGRSNVLAISLCFSADFVNFFMRKKAVTICCPRGNLFQNYRFDYNTLGLAFARFHYLLMKNYDMVIAMSNSMADQLRSLGIRRLKIIGNFLDEARLEPYRMRRKFRDDQIRFIFLGSLSVRKRPDLVINSFYQLVKEGCDGYLDIIGRGNLKEKLVQMVWDLGIDNRVTFYGHLPEPYDMIQEADFMLLPSESEGVSRAVMEALFFGVPCILRDIDANREIITDGKNGYLFKHDNALPDVMKKAALEGKIRFQTARRNLLPTSFRKECNVEKFIALIKSFTYDSKSTVW